MKMRGQDRKPRPGSEGSTTDAGSAAASESVRSQLRLAMTLLPNRSRRWIVIAVVGSSLLAALDMIGVAAMLPLLALLTGGTDSPLFPAISDALGTSDLQRLIVLTALLVASTFIIKSSVMILFRYWLLGHTSRLAADAASELLRRYALSPFAVHRQREFSLLYRNLGTAVNQTFGQVVVGLITFLSNLLTVVAILLVLIVASPLATLIAGGTFALTTLGLQRALRERQAKLGERIAAADLDAWRALMPALHGFREVRLTGAGQRFAGEYHGARRRMAQTTRVSTLLSELPRHILEIVFIVVIAGLSVLLFSTQDGETAVTVLGLFAAASVRMLPTLNQLSGTLTTIRVGLPGLKILSNEVQELDRLELHVEEIRSDAAYDGDLAFEHVSYSYPDSTELVLDDVSVMVRQGEMTAFVGSSGAGKSTLLDLALGLLEPTEGTISCGGRDIRQDRAAWLSTLGMVPQDVFLLDASVRENVAFGVPQEQIDDELVAEVLGAAKLTEVVAGLPEGTETRVGERGVRLSGGQRQRLGIARALYRRPSVLVLDEATSALDNVTEQEISATIESLKGELTIIVVAHRLSTVRDADRIVFMSGGRIAGVGDFTELNRSNAEFARLVSLGQLTPASTSPSEASTPPAADEAAT